MVKSRYRGRRMIVSSSMRRGGQGLRQCVAAGLLLLAVAQPANAEAIEGNTVVLQGLDKVTARVWTFDAPVGETVRFGTLEIHPRFCNRTPPEEPPEVKAFIEIQEVREGEEKSMLFSGWMFASSPALNALEHPVYDVWVLGCKSVAKTPVPQQQSQRTGR